MEHHNTHPEHTNPNNLTPHHLRSALSYAHFLEGKTLLDSYIRAGFSLDEAAGLVYQQGVHTGISRGEERVKERCTKAIVRERKKIRAQLHPSCQTEKPSRKPRTLHEALEQEISAQRAAAQAEQANASETEAQHG